MTLLYISLHGAVMDTNVTGNCDLLNAEFDNSEGDFSLRIPHATPLKHLILIFVKSQNYNFELSGF